MLEPETAERAAATGQGATGGRDGPGSVAGSEAAAQALPRVIPGGARIVRHVAEGSSGIVGEGEAGTATGERLIYSNTGGTLAYPPGANVRVADDLVSEAVGACGLTRYRVAVTGGVPSGTGVFSCTVALWTGCPPPQGTGTLIAGTESTFTGLSDDAAVVHELEVDLSGAQVSVSPTIWVSVQFDTPTAAWIVGSSAEIGFSGDYYHGPQLGCKSWFGGCPVCASFYIQLFAEEPCETHHLAYSAVGAGPGSLALGAGMRGAEDLLLTSPSCELSALEVYLRGTSGAYQVEFDFRNPEDPNPLPGTERTFTSHPQAGNGTLQVVRFLFPPGLQLPNPVWLVWKANRGNTGPISAARVEVGYTTPTICALDTPTWHLCKYPLPGIVSARVYCRGQPPPGACCPDLQSGQAPVCTNGFSAAACAGGRWIRGATCGTDADDPFDPPCGAHACCKPDTNCSDLTEEECHALVDSQTPPVSCEDDADCPPNRHCQADGTCSARTGIWQPGHFCTDYGFHCPYYPCHFSQGGCFQVDPELLCEDDDDCPGERICLISHCASHPTIECASDADCPGADFCQLIGNHVCDDRRGCGNLTCCDEVCRYDPFCCEFGWDGACVALAYSLCEVVPGNDVCGDPSPIRGAAEITLIRASDPNSYSGAASANNRYATTGTRPGDMDPVACCGNNGFNPRATGSLWYYFVMPDTPQHHTTARIHTCLTPPSDTATDSIIQVFDVGDSANELTACNSLRVIGCNDDASTCSNQQLSDVCVEGLLTGHRYYILVGASASIFQGPYHLDVQVPCPRSMPVNNTCGNAIGLPVTPTDLAIPFNLHNATLDCPTETCLPQMKNDIWYEYFSPCSGALTIETCGPTPADPDPPTTLAVYRIPDPADSCDLDIENLIGCNQDAAVNPFEHTLRSQTCEFLGQCSGNSGIPCRLGSGDCQSDEFCVQVECDTDRDCHRRCNRSGEPCLGDGDCNACALTGAPCVSNVDCLQCGLGGAPCRTSADCPPGVSCQFTQACVVSGDVCIPDACVSSCGAAAAVTVPVFGGRAYRIRLGGEDGAQPSGTLSIRCREDDCQPNLIPDLTDIRDGRSSDCNQNGEPDECDAAACDNAPWCDDCNTNEVLDGCDIRSGFSNDRNADGRPDECQCPSGAVAWLDPPDGVVDARQPSLVTDAAARLGIDTIVVSAPLGADEHCWQLSESATAGTPNAIADVHEVSGTYSIRLSRPITPGAATTITYRGTGGDPAAHFIAHPGNVDGDTYASARDIVRFVDCCINGVCPPRWGSYSCDINHSGAVTAEDICRLVDVLNGAGVFEPWHGTRRPMPN
ncbi:MAG: hypothetical protein HY763_06845 [Planctomycetes bacterium]|nr:hypothetical protein [Planctomycetota bacterium]